jgi:Tol biopolymer transport system component
MRQLMFASLLLLASAGRLPAAAQGSQTIRVNVSSTGVQANGYSAAAALARGGGFVAFLSSASNLVAGDTNGAQDVFVHDIVYGSTTRESVDSSGAQAHADSNSTRLGISADGRFVVFCSNSPNLVAGDTNGMDDVFLRDRLLGTTIRVSVGNAGLQGNRDSKDPSVSDDGRYVAFESYSNNWLSPDASFGPDVFLRDVVAGTTTLVGVNAQGIQASQGSDQAAVSGDGRFVAFHSGSPDMVPPGAFPNQVFVRSLLTGITSLESVNSGGIIGDNFSAAPFLSRDGRWLVFISGSTNFVNGALIGGQDGFLRDRVTGTTFHVTPGYGGADSNGACYVPSVSDDARYVAFGGFATNILPFDDNGPQMDSWQRDLAKADNLCIGVDTNGQAVTSGVWGLSSDGSVALFSSAIEPVVPGDDNGFSDFFVRTVPFESPIFFCTAKLNSLGCAPQLRYFGSSSSSQSSGFQIKASLIRNRKPGMLMYCISGRAALPFAGGTLCLVSVHRNTPALNSLGSPAPDNDCSGSYSLDMNAFAAGLLGGPPLPDLSMPGTTVQCQWWSRDPGFPAPNAIGLTAGIEYTVGT